MGNNQSLSKGVSQLAGNVPTILANILYKLLCLKKKKKNVFVLCLKNILRIFVILNNVPVTLNVKKSLTLRQHLENVFGMFLNPQITERFL